MIEVCAEAVRRHLVTLDALLAPRAQAEGQAFGGALLEWVIEVGEFLVQIADAPEPSPVETLRRIADQDIGGNCPWLADELHELAGAVELDMSGPASPPPRRYSFTRDSLIDALAHLEVHVATSGPAAGKVLAESMADALIEALGGTT